MAEQHNHPNPNLNPPSAAPSSAPAPPPLPPSFDPTRMVGIIKRKALIKDLAGVYHAECLAYCQELLELQRKWEWEEPLEDPRKDTVRPSKRVKKTR
ncbi:hypothetical protein HN51_036325 [Arachis hypogaea]|uniref:uncharacterized protein LOC107630534 n=1 Tax=Arachis ipaensis TaxID=130454 RepID=UPI0007AF3687|nr:uncharacterized protein LOC107630534 [Arachis ipaensis]